MTHTKNNVRRHPASMLYIIASILALLLFAAGAIFALFRKSDDGISFVEKQKLNHVIEKSTAEYKQENEKLLADFNKAIENAGKDKFNQARKNIPGIVIEFSKFKVNGKLAYKMAKDRIRKTNETRDAICSVVGPRVIEPCQKGHAELLNALQNYLHGLQENDNRYRAKLAQALNDIPANTEKSQARQDFLNDAVVKFERQAGEMAVTQLTTAAGTLIEIVMIRESVRLITSVCAKTVARIVGSATAGAVCAVADGPLPVGDIIGAGFTVGGLAWCAYDIHKVCKVLPAKMSNTLHQAVNDYEKKSREEVQSFALKALQDANAKSDVLAVELKKNINGGK